MAKEREEDQGPCAPDWIVTFADMISLLVTFFILLMTFSSLDVMESFKVKDNILGTTGTLTSGKGPSMIQPPPVDLMMAMDAKRGAPVPHQRPADKLLENLEEMGQKKTEDHHEIDLNSVEDGILLRYDDRASFAPGSIELTGYLREAVGELARVLENYPYTVVIEGHTDDHFRSTQLHPSETLLSTARATAVAQVMLESSKLNPLQIEVAGSGSSTPAASNDTPAGRKQNRRIEIRIMSLSEVRAAALRRVEESNG